MKSSVMHSSVQVNDKNIDDVQYLEPYTLYINPYYVVTELQGGDKVSKHYYMNTQRVATDISINYQAQESMAGPQQPNARDPKKPSEDTASVNYNAAFADLQATLNALGHQKIDVNGLGQQPTLEEYYPELVRETALNTTAAKNAPESTTRVLFWYHPDYLGNVDLVTERDGKTYEFFTYNPWGEEMHQYNANTFGFSSPYRFNSKEKDEETGLHYYGARYYQSKLSVWMSVDPKAHMAPDWTPYRFGFANPLLYTDPDGKFESPEKAREFAKANGIDGQILEYDNGTFALHDSQNGISYQQKSSGQVIQSVLLDPVDVIYENSSAHQDNDGVPEMNPDLSFGASIVTTEVGGAAELTISELGEKAAGQGLKTLAKSANFAGGVIGTVDNGIQAYNDYQKGNYGRSAVNGLQGAAYTTGTVMLFTPLAPVGGIILLSATISDWIQMGVEYQTGNTNY